MKRSKFERGDVLELRRNNQFGYCRVLGRDEFGTLVEILDTISEVSLPIELLTKTQFSQKEIVYVNAVSAKKNWRFVGNVPLIHDILPPVFNGHPNYGWTVYEKGRERNLPSSEVTYDDLIKRGYVSRTLWLSKHIEDAVFEGKQLRWV